jgi:chitodextrinase
LTVANRTHTSISLKWTASSDNIAVKGYELYRDGRKIVTVTKTGYTNMNLVPGKSYLYSVKAYDAAGNISESSTPLSAATINDTRAPSAPSGLYASSAAHTAIMLSWKPSTDNTGIKGYVVYCNGKKKGSTTSTSYTCKKLAPGTTYSFTVKSYDAAENHSAESNTCSAATMPDSAPPSIPEGLKASEVTETEVVLTWSPSSDNVKVKCYEVFCDGTRISTTSKTSFSCKKLAPGKSYTFTLKAKDATGNTSGSSTKLIVTTISDLEAPVAPNGFKISKVTKSSVSLKWNASTDNVKVKGYRIYYNGMEVADTSRTSYTVKGLKGLPIALLWIKAYDTSGNLSKSSGRIPAILP